MYCGILKKIKHICFSTTKGCIYSISFTSRTILCHSPLLLNSFLSPQKFYSSLRYFGHNGKFLYLGNKDTINKISKNGFKISKCLRSHSTAIETRLRSHEKILKTIVMSSNIKWWGPLITLNETRFHEERNQSIYICKIVYNTINPYNNNV